MNKSSLNKLITQACDIEEADAREVGALGYMARVLVQATLPHRNLKSNTFERTNGVLSLALIGHPKVGLPYGVYPRLLLAWLVTEAVQKRNPHLILGSNLSQFMSELGLIPTGGRWGSISRLRDQMRRLFSASISCVYKDKSVVSGLGFNITKEYNLWWDPKNPDQMDFWQSTVTLGNDFFNEIIERPVPIDMRALKALKTSSMALDLYCWLTYRLSYLKRPVEIPWIFLQQQFGSDYADTKQGRYEFKRKLLKQLKKVSMIYDAASRTKIGTHGLIVIPGASHIIK